MTQFSALRILILMLMLGILGATLPLLAQSEFEIMADESLNWDRDLKQYHALGNAVVKTENITLRADEIIAYYQTIDGQDRILRADAIGRVIAQNGASIAYGDKGVYHMESDIIVLIGKDLRVINQNGKITAKDTIEYWNKQNIAVARGDATLQQQDKFVRAGTLTAFINADQKQEDAPKQTQEQNNVGDSQVYRVDATGGVHVSTATEILVADQGVYLVPEQEFKLCGNLKITRGENQLNGECANLNMATGVSQMLGGSNRIQGLIVPQKKQESPQ